jgi:hypothetical protein
MESWDGAAGGAKPGQPTGSTAPWRYDGAVIVDDGG